MAEVIIAPADVYGVGTLGKSYYSGEALLAGQMVYKKTTDNKLYKASNHLTVVEAVAFGIMLNDCPGIDQPASVLTSGSVYIGAGKFPQAGRLYVLGGNGGVGLGSIQPYEDLVGEVAPKFITYVGYSTSTTTLCIDLTVMGTQWA